MNEIVAKFIFLFLLGSSILNFGIAIVSRFKTKHKEFNHLVLYWPAVILTFITAAILSKTPQEIVFAYFFHVFSSNLLVQIMCDVQGIKSHWKKYVLVQLAAMGISTYLILETTAGFTLSLIPLCVAYSLPFIRPIWFALVENKKESSWIEKSLALVLIVSVIHHFNMALFRLDVDNAAWGWAITLAVYQCISVFLPLLINHRRELTERNNIESVIEQISGSRPVLKNERVEDLYQQLELQIAQKDEIYKQLKNSNESLQEEREINEILIKTISHDLANPLTVINAYAEMLRGEKIPQEDVQKIWNRLQTNISSSLDMISRIRHAILTRSQASLVSVHHVSIDNSLKKLLETFDMRLKEKDIKVSYRNKLPLDTFVLGEQTALVEHVFANILSNAIKFSFHDGEISINVTDADNYVQISFQDQGVGIQKARLNKKLLHSTEGTSGELGSGFGMMVMGYFLRKFSGSFEINSNGQNEGTTVSVYLQKASVKLQDNAPSSHGLPTFSASNIE